nr:l-type lectin-domain containing receptor kinase s.4 [Quercus suber]
MVVQNIINATTSAKVIPKYPDLGGHVLAFILTSTKEPKDYRANQYLGPPNVTSKTESSSWILAVEFNIIQNPDFQDINDNHVEIDISSLISNISEPAAYYNSTRKEDNYNNSIILKSGNPIQAIKSQDEILEDWEVEYRARRFKHSELFSATHGFGEKNIIGSGGFGRVYRVAIKRVTNYSCQGMKEFVAEITSMGCLGHRNLVQLHGWCCRLDKLLLVYDYVPNGSLDKLLFDIEEQRKILTGKQRYKILIGVAQALLYLHEESEQRVVHKDVKPSNVLTEAKLNAWGFWPV